MCASCVQCTVCIHVVTVAEKQAAEYTSITLVGNKDYVYIFTYIFVHSTNFALTDCS